MPHLASSAAPFAGPHFESFLYIKVLLRQFAIILPQYVDLDPPPMTEIESHWPPALISALKPSVNAKATPSSAAWIMVALSVELLRP